jgi:DNA mismatch repair ATPase MutS
LDRFLKILVQDFSRHVAIAEEFPNDAAEKVRSGGLMHNRRVTRIVTPGTLIDENFMDPYANNYVMAIYLPEKAPSDHVRCQENLPPPETPETSVGLAWLDLSTGYFFTQPTTLASLGSVLSRVSPREIVLDKALESDGNNSLLSVLQEERYLVSYSPQGGLRQLSDWAPMLESEIPAQTVDKFTDSEVQAGSLLLHYVGDRLQGLSMKLQPPLRHESMHIMNIDKSSMRSLEIKQTIRDGVFRGSLLHAIRRTVTKSGARLLNEWLSRSLCYQTE